MNAFVRTFPVLLLLAAAPLGGCNEYWRSRGQPPSVTTLLTRSSANLEQNVANFGKSRAEVVPVFQEINASLDSVVDLARKNSAPETLTPQFEKLAGTFIGLEEKLSLGSRPAYGELSGELRALAADNREKKRTNPSTIGLFAARTKNFLASELSVPAPVN